MRSASAKIREALAAGAGFISGLIPHILHHAGLVIGISFLAGTVGTILFGILGLILTIPLLIQLHKKFNNYAAPVLALALFTIMFFVSSFIIGPAIRGTSSSNKAQQTEQPSGSHESHH